MGDVENALPPSKKRAAGRELTKDNAGLDDDEAATEPETGTFKRASEGVLATRRIVKVRRNQTTSAPSSNPFATIHLVPPPEFNATSSATSVAQAAGEEKVSDEVDEKDEENKLSESKTDEAEDGSSAQEVKAVEKESSYIGIETAKHEQLLKEVKSENEDKKDNERETVNSGVAQAAGEEKVSDEVDEKDEENKLSESKTDEAQDGSSAQEVKTVEKESSNIGIETAKHDEQPVKEVKSENEDKKNNGRETVNSGVEGTPLSSFQQLSSSQNAFTGLAGTGISTSTFSFGSISTDGSRPGTASVSLFGGENDKPFGLNLSNNGSSFFGTSGASTVAKTERTGFPSMQEIVVETGEEHEEVVFTADSVLFEFIDGGWKERGKGELKVNVSTTETERARLLMRARGNYRLIMNASLYPDMKLTNMEKKGITFACINSASEGKDGLSTFALKFKDGSIVEEFRAAVAAHKGKASAVLKTPENSPKASDD